MIRKIIGRLSDLFRSRIYRRVVWARFLDYLIRSFNPNVKYLGLADGEGLILLSTGESVVTPYALAEDGFQKNDINRALEIARKHSCKLGGTFLDVGAHIGTSAIYAIKSGKFDKAFCFEPVPKNIAHLEMNIKLNHLEDRIHIIPKAVTLSNKRQTMFLSDTNSGDNRVDSGKGSIAGKLTDKIEVECVSLDSFLESEHIDVGELSFVWLDTQGNEGNVLQGAQSILQRKLPICLEFWPWALKANNNFEELILQLQRHYVEFYDMRNLEAGCMTVDLLRDYSKRFSTDDDHTDLLIFGDGN